MPETAIKVHKGRVTTVRVNLGIDVSDDLLTSEIRSEPNPESTLIGTWAIENVTDGTDGQLLLTLDDEESVIIHTTGYMDIKRVSGGIAIPLFDKPIVVVIQETVTL